MELAFDKYPSVNEANYTVDVIFFVDILISLNTAYFSGYFIVGLFCYICSFLFFLWLFSFTYTLLAGPRFTCRG
jgi:hypothetical protein